MSLTNNKEGVSFPGQPINGRNALEEIMAKYDQQLSPGARKAMNASIAIDTLLQEVNTLTRKLAEAEATIKRLDDENTTLVCRMLDRGKRIEEMERLQRDNEFLIAECGNLSDSRVDTMKNLKASQERVKELEDLLREARGHIHDEYCCAFGDMSLENKIEAALTQPQEKQV